ncbi:TetR/AcrR family transcriptional regulator [Gordonia sp. NPDC003376]
MPRISDERKQERREQILEAARICFHRKGFHKTSIADVIAESGLSAGAVYSYYSSKEELIAAVARSILLGYAETTSQTLDGDPVNPALSPAETLSALGGRIVARLAPGVDDFRLLLTVWGEAAANPAFREIATEIISGLRAFFTTVLRHWGDDGHPLPMEPEEMAPVMLAMLQGVVFQQAVVGDLDSDAYLESVRKLLVTAGL